MSNLKSISDGVNPSGSASASLSSIGYDDLHRVTSLTSTARGDKSYSYDSIGNTLVNQDYGAGTYAYGAKPHAVTSANGKSYTYDACGNMVTRGSQTLTYDEQNQLVRVSYGGTNVLFGYTEGGERLWRAGTNGYTVWIGGIYELNNGKVLCHVFAGGQRVATFEPQCGSWAARVVGEDRWFAATTAVTSAMNWPFQKGRTPYTLLTLTFLGMLGVCFAAARQLPVTKRVRRRLVGQASRLSLTSEYPRFQKVSSRFQFLTNFCLRLLKSETGATPVLRHTVWRLRTLWKQAVTLVSIAALMLATTPNAEAATFNPVFYYYHGDHLGSSSVLTDRTGERVQHYEYTTYGKEGFKDNSSAFEISHRYTGQILDDETGLYYYGARYYDPALGRFVQADTIVPSAANPQTLNRYAYCGNNPLKYVDPSGHFFFAAVFAIVAVAAAGAAVGAVTSAALGGDIGMGALTGAISAAGVFAGGIIGGAAAGAINATITGSDPGIGALTGAISAGIGFAVSTIPLPDNVAGVVIGHVLSATSGALAGGIGAELAGGDFAQGAAQGAAGALIAYGIQVDLPEMAFAAQQAVTNAPAQGAVTNAPSSRPLTTGEIDLAKSVYGTNVNYWLEF